MQSISYIDRQKKLRLPKALTTTLLAFKKKTIGKSERFNDLSSSSLLKRIFLIEGQKDCFFSSKNIFERKIFNSIADIIFTFPETTDDAQAYACMYCETVSDFCVSVTAVKKSEVAGSNPADDHKFYLFLDIR